MTDDLNVNENRHKSSTSAEEFNKDLDGVMIPPYEEITIMKTEVTEEVYDFVNENLHKSSTAAEEFNKDLGDKMMPFHEEITIMKTEVKEEVYDFEISADEMEGVNMEQESHFVPNTILGEEDLMLAKSTEQSLNKNLVVGNYENKETDLQNNKYICHLCRSEFEDKVYLKSHYEQCFNPAEKILPENKNAVGTYGCLRCAYSTPIREHFIIHSAIHKGDKSNVNLTKHKLMKHSSKSKKYNCKECRYVTESKGNLTKHMHVHSNDKTFKCTYKNCKCPAGQEESCECSMCCYAGACSRNLRRHILTKHSVEPKRYQCGNCKYATHRKAYLVIHNYIHTGEKPFKCTYKNCKCISGQEKFCRCNTCGFASTYNVSLKQHILTKHTAKPKKYKCNNCEYSTHFKASLVVHNRIHTREKPFKCTYKNCKCAAGQEESCECSMCCYATTCSDYLRKHILAQHSVNPKKYQCSNCEFATLRKARLLIHNRIHTREKPYKCTYKNCKCTPGQEQFCGCNTCGFASTNNVGLKQHILIKHTVEKKYKCNNCEYSTHFKASLATHNYIHSDEKPFKCTYKNCKCAPGQEEFCRCNACGFSFTNNIGLKHHILTKHSVGPKKYKCNNCGYSTHFKASLVTHNYIHSGEKPVKCTYKNCKCAPGQKEFCECNTCGYSFTNNFGLKQHILTKHSVEPKKYKCNNCEYSTHIKASLVTHNYIHSDEKPFKCTYKNCKCAPEQKEFCGCNTCGFSFTNNIGLKLHILTKHSVEPKKYKCINCEYSTHLKANLVTHNYIHRDEKRFKCTYKNCKCAPDEKEFCRCNTCGFSFKNNIGLEVHILIKHSVKPKIKYKCNNCEYSTHFKASLVTHSHIHTEKINTKVYI